MICLTLNFLTLRILAYSFAGLVVAGYKVVRDENGKDKWTLLGKRSPQTPQMFYPVEDKSPIKQGDIMAARCTMRSKKDRYTYTG